MKGQRRRTVAVIQARCSSTRLPRKILLPLGGEPMLARVVERVRMARLVDEVYVATSVSPDDDAVEEVARARGWRHVRGSLNDVLSRFQVASAHADADVVVRITADCPFIDPTVIDRVIEVFRDADPGVDYASNVWPKRTFPRGLDTEVFTRQALETIAARATQPRHREHVTQFVHENPDSFRTVNVTSDVDTSHHRWTVDTAEDLRLARLLYEHLPSLQFRTQDVLALLSEHPEWSLINAAVKQKTV